MLFKEIKKLVQYAEIDVNTRFDSVKATIKSIEDQQLVPVLGSELYNGLNNAYTAAADETALSAAHKALLEKCRLVIGPLTCYFWAPKADVKLSDQGMTRSETAQSKTAYQEQRTHFREANLREGEGALEVLIRFLEENKADYPVWTASAAFAKYRSLFIKTGAEFNEMVPTHSPYRNYWAMRPKMFDVEEKNIRKLIGNTLFDALKAKDTAAAPATPLTTEEKILLTKIKKAIAYLTLAFAVPVMNIRMDANGITVAASNRTTDDQITPRNAANDNALSVLVSSCKDSGIAWMNMVTDYLNLDANENKFTGWPLAAKTYTPTKTGNDQRKGSFGFF